MIGSKTLRGDICNETIWYMTGVEKIEEFLGESRVSMVWVCGKVNKKDLLVRWYCFRRNKICAGHFVARKSAQVRIGREKKMN